MRRVATAVVFAALVATATGFALTAKGSASSGKTSATKLTVWVGWSARELKEFKGVVAEYDKQHSEVDIKVVGSINDTKITNAIR